MHSIPGQSTYLGLNLILGQGVYRRQPTDIDVSLSRPYFSLSPHPHLLFSLKSINWPTGEILKKEEEIRGS